MAGLRERLRALARAQAAPRPAENWTSRDVPVDEGAAQPVARRLLDRLRPEDVDAVEAALDGEATALWAQATPPHRAYLTLAYGVHFRVPGVLERTGLTTDDPPPDVHAMGRGPLAAGGDYYTADLVAEALLRAGTDIGGLRRALDFGCSSGRVLRPLVVAYPDVEWHGVDPNAGAVAWAAEHVNGASFATSASDPPLDFPDDHFDLVYAISIWSHFGERSAHRWLDEMRRMVAPGGHLLLTVHSAQSIAHNRAIGARSHEQLIEIAIALHQRGFWYAPEFGSGGDHGVVHPEWGTAFMSAEWLLRAVTPAWHVVSYAVGRNDGNQDVAVLRRPPADPC
jgi:SAM-dependent methyltransferase